MKERTIIFPFDDADGIGEKVVKLTKIVGKDNIVTEGLKFQPPEVTIKCNKKKWRDIKFKLLLDKAYY